MVLPDYKWYGKTSKLPTLLFRQQILIIFKLRAHGHCGIRGALALVHVIMMQNGIEQGASQVVTCHALAVQLRKQAVQVFL